LKAVPHKTTVHETGGPSPQRIQHPNDREASEALREVSGLDDLVGFVMKHALEKMERVNNVGGKVRVGPQQVTVRTPRART
jgi:hypothetical protein